MYSVAGCVCVASASKAPCPRTLRAKPSLLQRRALPQGIVTRTSVHDKWASRNNVKTYVALPDAPESAWEHPHEDDNDAATCPAFIDASGDLIPVMCCDFGVRTAVHMPDAPSDITVPTSAFDLAWTNFRRELKQLLPFSTSLYNANGTALSRNAAACEPMLRALTTLTLDDAQVAAREHTRPPIPAAWPIKTAFDVLCWLLDVLYAGRPIQRFWVLETVARVPYFAFLSVLHLYESLGWWRNATELKHVHFAEEYNESHHLAIMESLGGDGNWFDRFVAQHCAVVYYWIVAPLYMLSPSSAYRFGELVEAHASDTYSQFLEENEEALRSLPPPRVAVEYYRGTSLALFDAFQTSLANTDTRRRPMCHTLYDVFVNVRDDELEHVCTMQSLSAGRNDDASS